MPERNGRVAPWWLVGLVALCCGAVIGCGAGDGKAPVEGRVTWNGEPVLFGSIIFEPAGGSGVPDAGTIERGRYSLRATPGPKRVQIHATRAEGPVDPVMGLPPQVPYIPEHYNRQTELSADVQAGAQNVFNFALPTPSEAP